MPYTDIMALGADSTFLNRVIYAVEKFCAYVQNEGTGVQNHPMRLNWAILAMENPLATAVALMPGVLQMETVQAQLGAIVDGDLQIAVESVIGTRINASPSYSDVSTLAADGPFVRRIQTSVAKFCAYILGETPSTANHSNRYNWAKTAMMSAGTVAQSIATAVVLDANVAPAMAGVSDAALQSAVEAQITQLYL